MCETTQPPYVDGKDNEDERFLMQFCMTHLKMAGGAKAVVQMTIHQAGRPRQRQMFNTYMILTKCANKIAKSEKSLSRCDAPVRLEDMCKSEKNKANLEQDCEEGCL